MYDCFCLKKANERSTWKLVTAVLVDDEEYDIFVCAEIFSLYLNNILRIYCASM